MLKKNLLFFTKAKVASIFFCLLATVLFYLCTKLFFYDEDIFIVNIHSYFMSDLTRAALVKFTFLADNFLYKTNATGYHVTSVVLHLLNALLATYAFKMLLRSSNLSDFNIINACYIFFFLFLLSPVHSEPICYLLGRAGLVVSLFCTLSLILFIKANFQKPSLLIFSLGFFLLALFSYEISWTFPLIILAIAYYLKSDSGVDNKTFTFYVTPYFLVFGTWFFFKAFFLDNLNVTPYGNNIFLSLSPSTLLKNSLVLFARNLVPPFVSTALFVAVSFVFGALGFYIFLKIRRRNKALFNFGLLLIFMWFLAFTSAIAFGINSHNSESERYIYFSSVFAIMFVATIFGSLKNCNHVFIAVVLICSVYGYFLFTTIYQYVQGGNFSRSYLNVLGTPVCASKNVYLINQPSQYNGALLFRALGNRKNDSVKRLNVINDYMRYLNIANDGRYITLSKRAITKDDLITKVLVTHIDSMKFVFPEMRFNNTKSFLVNSLTGDSVFFEKENGIVVGLKPPLVYIFK